MKYYEIVSLDRRNSYESTIESLIHRADDKDYAGIVEYMKSWDYGSETIATAEFWGHVYENTWEAGDRFSEYYETEDYLLVIDNIVEDRFTLYGKFEEETV